MSRLVPLLITLAATACGGARHQVATAPAPRSEAEDPAPDAAAPISRGPNELPAGGSDVLAQGATDRSGWGSERDARGDPYVGELRGRIHHAWWIPSVDAAAGSVLGCIRLDPGGTIVERDVIDSSGNDALDESVMRALDEASDMEAPVPAHLLELLTDRGVCLRFQLD
jgi:outer membrane biosynthesis protein TonB